jgi:hypothetical protein
MSPESGSETVRVRSMLASDLLQRRETAFTFWIPNLRQRPVLVIGNFAAGNPNELANRRDIRLVQDSTHPGLWAVTATDTGLSRRDLPLLVSSGKLESGRTCLGADLLHGSIRHYSRLAFAFANPTRWFR